MGAMSGADRLRRRRLLAAAVSSAAAAGLAACGGGAGTAATASPGPSSPAPSPSLSAGAGKSAKRGIAYDIATAEDLQALSPGVSWWYDWGQKAAGGVPADHAARDGMDFIPMLWKDFAATDIEAVLAADPGIKHLLVMNEPNLTDQANLTPQAAARLWPAYEAVAAKAGVKLVGPAITWGTMPGYADPVAWLDAFHAAYGAANANRPPRIDYLAFHWYDYGLADQLDRLLKYGKPFWVTEMANWHVGDGAAQIDSVAKQKAQMADMVRLCEGRADVFRYAWFTGRRAGDLHFTSLLGANGQLTELGRYYLELPF
ncbi:MAG: glycoside hydrolase family protein [Burkholderiaceae bacterium]